MGLEEVQVTDDDPNAPEADDMFEKHLASLERLGTQGLRDRYVTPDHRGGLKAGFPVTSEAVGPSGRIYQFETHISLEGDDVHVFVSMFPDRKVALARDTDFIVPA